MTVLTDMVGDNALPVVTKVFAMVEGGNEHLWASTGDKELDEKLGGLRRILRQELPDKLPPKRAVEHSIDTNQAAPTNRAAYSLSQVQLLEQRRQILELMNKGLIRPSSSPWGSPVLFVKKSDNTWRMCVDYRALNSVTVKNTYPLPKIQECLDQLGTARYFTKLDCLSGYWQIRVLEGDVAKTAFNTRMGKFEYRVMPFGLCNAPATFQSTMNDLLRDALDQFVIVYIDDILIYSKTREEHMEHVKHVLERLATTGFYLKQSKCEFLQTKIKFCGHIISEGKIEVDPEKIDSIRNWPRPKDTHEVRQFLGLSGYYRRFVDGYAAIATPLTDLIKNLPQNKKNAIIEWLPRHEVAFIALKGALCSAPILIQPNQNEPFQIATDASDFARGAVLLQADAEGRFHPVAFASKKFTDAETRYPVHEKEMSAIMLALRQ